ncbi:MAG: hypothetical protein AABY22_27330 [Nanoarchaeota archaeon]
MKKELKHIKGLAKVLSVLVKEVKKKGYFDKEDQELLKKVGSSLLFKGTTFDYKNIKT